MVLRPAPPLVPPQCSQFAVCVWRLSSSLLIWSAVRTDGHVIQLDYWALLWLLGRHAASVRLLAAPDVCRHLCLWSGDEEQQPDSNASSDLMKTGIVFSCLRASLFPETSTPAGWNHEEELFLCEACLRKLIVFCVFSLSLDKQHQRDEGCKLQG